MKRKPDEVPVYFGVTAKGTRYRRVALTAEGLAELNRLARESTEARTGRAFRERQRTAARAVGTQRQAARRAATEALRARVLEHFQKHPHHTSAQAARALAPRDLDPVKLDSLRRQIARLRPTRK